MALLRCAVALGLAASAAAQMQMRGVAPVNDLAYDKVLEFGDFDVSVGEDALQWSFSGGSQCSFKYKQLPWAIDCELDINLGVPAGAAINTDNDGMLNFTFYAGVLFENDDTPEIELRYGVITPEIEFGPDWIEAIGLTKPKIDSIKFPPAPANELSVGLPIGDVTNGLCLLENLPELTVLFPNLHPIALAVDEASDWSGIEACLRLANFTMTKTSGIPGASFQLMFSLHFLDETHMEKLQGVARDAVIQLRNTIFDRDSAIILDINVGNLIRGKAFLNQQEPANATYDSVVAPDGSFLVGSDAEDFVPPPPVADIVTEIGDEELEPEPTDLTVPLAVSGSAVVLVAVGSALFVKMRRRNAQSHDHSVEVPEMAVANPRFQL